VLDARGEPVAGAVVEIWQVDGHGAYLHSRGEAEKPRDRNFQGFGRFLTNRKGEYYFRTIKPVPYPGRTPHIHFAVNQKGRRTLTTQLFVGGEKQNAGDGIYQRFSKEERKLVTIDFKPVKDSKIGELEAMFDLVLGVTPQEA
jgi:protocatechuate 3,4-dioxygenase beta subunit